MLASERKNYHVTLGYDAPEAESIAATDTKSTPV